MAAHTSNLFIGFYRALCVTIFTLVDLIYGRDVYI